MTTAKRVYLRDLARYEAEGWRPCLDAEGRIRVLASPTGTQTYVWQEAS